VRILHISDLHISATAAEIQDQVMLVKAMLNDVATLNSEIKVDLAIVTGDLAFAGGEKDYSAAETVLLDPLCERINLERSAVVLVPGNHDVNRNLIKRYEELGLKEALRDSEDVDALLDNGDELSAAAARLEEWDRFHERFYANSEGPNRVGPLAWVHRWAFDDRKVAAVGLNSSWRSSGDADKGSLLIGDRQLRPALDAIDDADVRIAAFHHPLTWLAKFDADSAKREFENRSIIVCSGHEHEPDPTGEASVRGYALYSRAGCLYQGRGYRNGYSVMDIDARSESVSVLLRSWYSERLSFDAALDRVRGGRIELTLPKPGRTALASLPKHSHVMAALAEVARETSLAPRTEHTDEISSVTDLLVEPRFYGAPFRELATAAKMRPGMKGTGGGIPRGDGNAALAGAQALIVTGEPQSGVSDALVWLLSQRYERDASRQPAYVRYRPLVGGRPVEKLLSEGVRRFGYPLAYEAPLPPMVAAMDDVEVANPKHLKRLATFVKQSPESQFILGCHGETHRALAEALREQSIEVEILFLGPFGRGELRQLIQRIVGDADDALTHKILDVAFGEGLPRTPFVMAALVLVLADDPEVQTLNESTILDSYTRLLLGLTDMVPPSGPLDVRGREHLLGSLARHMRAVGEVTLQPGEIEAFILEYFDVKGWGKGMSAGKVLQDLIARWMLVEDGEGVRFRHRVLMDLFVAKQMLDDPEFAQGLLTDPIGNYDPVRHAAALKRSDAELLRRVGDAATAVIQEITKRVSIDLFDQIQDPHALSADPDVDALARQLELYPTWRENEEIRDQAYEDLEVHSAGDGGDMGDQEADSRLRATLDFLPAVSLLSEVLASSELVDDVEMKTELLKQAVHGWSVAIVIMTVREDQTSWLHDLFQDTMPEEALGLLDWLVGVTVTFAVSATAAGLLGRSQLDGAISNALEDEAFLTATAPALITTLIGARYRRPGWVDDLRRLQEDHGGQHPYVRELIRAVAIGSYHMESISDQDAAALEDFIAGIAVKASPGQPSVQERARIRSRAIQELQDNKRRVLKDMHQLVETTIDPDPDQGLLQP
jgi:predicted MPP superfamily phosphohydrolase